MLFQRLVDRSESDPDAVEFQMPTILPKLYSPVIQEEGEGSPRSIDSPAVRRNA